MCLAKIPIIESIGICRYLGGVVQTSFIKEHFINKTIWNEDL